MRSVRLFGLTALSVIALIVLAGAASASASQFRAEQYEATVAGSQKNQIITVNGGNFKCGSIDLSGGLASASSSLPVTPTFSKCTLYGVSATVSSNSCQLVFYSTNESAPYTGTLGISCAKGGDAIVINAPILPCQMTIPPQTGRGPVQLENVGINANRTVTATLNIPNLEYTLSGAGCMAGSGTYENGKATGGYSLRALAAPESAQKMGLYLANEQIAAQPKLRAEYFPVFFGDYSWAGQTTLDTNTYLVKGVMRTEGSLKEASADISLTPSFSGFTYFGSKVTVAPNGCTLVLHATSEVTGTADISCPAGMEITVTSTASNCVEKIPAQSGLKSVTFENLGSGAGRYVLGKLSLGKLKYSETGSACSSPGTFENGSLTSSVQLLGHKFVLSGPQEGVWME